MAWRRHEIQPEYIAALLGGNVRIEPFPVPHDCLDGFGEAFWARPEAYLDPGIRAGISAFGLLDEQELSSGLQQLQADLRSGTWDARNSNLRQLGELDRLRTPADHRNGHRCRRLKGQATLSFDQGRDPEAVRMAAFTAEDPDDRSAFNAHMAKLRSSPDITLRAVTRDGRLVGTARSMRPASGWNELSAPV